MEEKDHTTAYVLVGLFFVILLIIVIVTVASNDSIRSIFNKDGNVEVIEQNYSRFELVAQSNGEQVYSVSYRLMHGTEMLQEGILNENYRTEFMDLTPQHNYTLEVDSLRYYSDPKTCFMSDSQCTIRLTQIGKIYLDLINYTESYTTLIKIEKGILKDTAFCIEENTNRIIRMTPDLVGIGTNLVKVHIPKRLSGRYRSCYRFKTYPQFEERYRQELEKEYDSLEKYNEENVKSYEFWSDVPYTDDDLYIKNFYELEQGQYLLNIMLEINPQQDWIKGDRFRITVIDMYKETESFDIKENDVEIELRLK